METRRRSLLSYTNKPITNISSSNYSVDLNGWRVSNSVSNPDPSLYDGVIESYSNYHIDNSRAIMTINISGLKQFTLYIRSSSQAVYDYVMVSQLDTEIEGGTSYGHYSVKAHTYGISSSNTSIENYKEVVFDHLDGKDHFITVVYRKDSSGSSGADRGYVLIKKNNPVFDGTVETSDYLTIEALEDNLSVYLTTNDCEYCVDGIYDWKPLSALSSTESINTGHTLSFRGKLIPNPDVGIGTFKINKKFRVSGNVMSMLFGDSGSDVYSLKGKKYAFYKLFYNCTTLQSVASTILPATVLSWSCYESMFEGCTSLINTPAFPATTLEFKCCRQMFYGCSNLVTVSSLSCNTLASRCYEYMFAYCTSLKNPPALNAENLDTFCYCGIFAGCTSLTTAPKMILAPLKQGCYSSMFRNCTNLINPPKLQSKTVTDCFSNMFSGCTSLTTAPDLLAKVIEPSSYSNMFSGCTKLNYIKMLATSGTMFNWVDGVSSSGTFVKAADAEWSVGPNGIPEGWEVINV
jgi:hypothetical protein